MTTRTLGPGQVETAGTVAVGDQLIVDAGGASLGESVYGYELLGLNSRGTSGTTVETGGTLQVWNSAIETTSTVHGQEILSGTGTGDTASSGGTITIENGGVEQGGVISGGTIDASAVGASIGTTTTTFDGAGRLDLNVANGDPTSQIVGFGAGDTIDIAGLSYGSFYFSAHDDSVNFYENTDYKGTEIYSLNFALANHDSLTAVSDGHGGVTLQEGPVCFLAGTAIGTADGTQAVEELMRGDLVRTADGAIRPVRWVGRQTVSTRFGDPLRVLPIRVRAGAIADGVPARDLLVSPDHALLVGGVLVQAGALVNGATIVREAAGAETLVYYHVELADHALILAEGVPAETFIDNVDRMAFDNWAEHEALGEDADADAAPMAEMALPRAKAARQIPASVQAMLAAREAALGFGAVAESEAA